MGIAGALGMRLLCNIGNDKETKPLRLASGSL
jgi:hypothetical protein